MANHSRSLVHHRKHRVASARPGLGSHPIELHSVSESLDTSIPHGRFVLTLFGGLAQMERELIGERTRSALAFKRENGQPTSHPPLGFTANGGADSPFFSPDGSRVGFWAQGAWRVASLGSTGSVGGGGLAEVVWVTRDGTAEEIDPGWTGNFRFPKLSPDGTQLAVLRGVEREGGELTRPKD